MKAISINKKPDENQSIAVNENPNDVVNFRAYEKKDANDTVKKSFFWSNKDKQ